MAHDVFISYRRDGGSETARLIRSELQERGFKVFLDVENLGPAQFDESLLREIESCPNFIVILSRGAVERCVSTGDWLCREIKHAFATGRNIIPVLKDGFLFPPKDQMPPGIAELPRHQAVEYSHGLFEVLGDQLGHLEHAHLLLATEDGLQCGIRIDQGLHLVVL
ncbi:MAG: toll/interleukin-1 receptor domain-containing protein [Kiritimatiellaeota bacterium]|nr:toll/interleukin-1 receptor domain-containing protein [Kiritimatiellota bacterium]